MYNLSYCNIEENNNINISSKYNVLNLKLVG